MIESVQSGRKEGAIMKETRKIMQVVTLLYLVLVGIGLYIAAKVLPAESLLNAILPLALILIVLWFVLIFATLKWQSRKKEGFPMNDSVRKMLEYNRIFVDHEMYQRYETTKYPDRKIAILSCMDTRMTELLPAALGIKNGDVKLIKNAGGQITHPYGSVIFSLLVAVYELGVDTILVIGHDDCGGRCQP